MAWKQDGREQAAQAFSPSISAKARLRAAAIDANDLQSLTRNEAPAERREGNISMLRCVRISSSARIALHLQCR